MLSVLCVLMGLCEGCFISLLGPIAIDIIGPEGAGQAIGSLFSLFAIPNFAGPVIAGKLRDMFGSYQEAFIFAGCPPLLAACLLCLTYRIDIPSEPVVHKLKDDSYFPPPGLKPTATVLTIVSDSQSSEDSSSQDEPASARILGRVRPQVAFKRPLEIVTVCRKDSQDITPDDRKALLREIKERSCNEEQRHLVFIVSHGTDSLLETARELQKGLDFENLSGKIVVVLTGSFLPEAFRNSDADFNVGVALGGSQAVDRSGVFVAMNGVFRSAECVMRNEDGTFVAMP
ncbi:unnamed protein product [Cyprideis torosa]|uniref:L-asparaginase N-terminal domain-containing protein n=1 Tax=Cyprideis torosa TaxID=163714 RepID=A0A7R8ZT38_9CRUS|nr:unnamed protein product [Cyprideis torosa]CAG0897116.1 unnamed protein product [Cyprideis torosa]